MARDDEFQVEIAGPGASPDTVDTLRLLRLGLAFTELVRRLGAENGLAFTGLSVVEKCVSLSCAVNQPQAAKAASARALRLVSGNEDPPHGAETATDEVRGAIIALSPGQVARVLVGPWAAQISVPPDFEPHPPPWERTEQRVHVVRVGGKRPIARLRSDSEDGEFSLRATPEMAQKLGQVLYRDADVEMEVVRDASGRIEGGRVLDVHPLEEDSDTAWRSWFRDNLGEWDTVDDIEGELGRRSD